MEFSRQEVQARILEWVVISFFGGSSLPRVEPVSSLSPALQLDSLPDELLGNPTLLFPSINQGVRLDYLSAVWFFVFVCLFF